MSFPRRLTNIAAGALMLGGFAFAAPIGVAADDDDTEYGAYLYAASCDGLSTDAIIEDVGDLDLEDDQDDLQEYWDRLGNGQDMPDKLNVEDEGVKGITLEDLTSESHAVAVHAHDSKDADVIACGDITGTPDNGSLLIELSEVDDSGVEGRAHFAPNRDNGIEVTTGAYATGQVDPLGTPEAGTPQS